MNLWVISDSGWVSKIEALEGAATAAVLASAVTTMVVTSVPSVPVAVTELGPELGGVSSAWAAETARKDMATLQSSK